MPGGRGEALQVSAVDRGDHRATAQVGIGDEERIDRELGTGADATEELPGADAGPGVHRMDLDPLAPETTEHPGIRRTAADHFGEDGGDRRDGELSCPHGRDEGTDFVSTALRAVGEGRDGLTVQ
jgi:hypothetical protein